MHNHSICDPCWDEKFPNRVPVRVRAELGRGTGDFATCCFCGRAHYSGIFVRGSKRDNCGASGPAGNMLYAPPKAAVSVSKADAPEPCTKCPEGVSPHAANYVLRWRDGLLQCERRACSRVMPDMIEDVLLGNEIEP